MSGVGAGHVETRNGTRWRRRASRVVMACPRSRRATTQSPRRCVQVTRGRRQSYRFRQTPRRPAPRRATPGKLSKLRTGRRRAGLSRRSRPLLSYIRAAPYHRGKEHHRNPASIKPAPGRAPNPITPPAWGIALNRRFDLHAIDATYT